MKKNLNRLLLLPVSAIAINQAQATDKQDSFNEQHNQFETKEIENYTGGTQYRFNSNNYMGETNENEIDYNNNDYNYSNEHMTSMGQMDTFNNNINYMNSTDMNTNFMLRAQVYNYIKDNRILTNAAALHGGSISDFVQKKRIDIEVLVRIVQEKYNGAINQAAKDDINKTVLKCIFQYMTIREAFADAGLNDHSSIVQAVLKVAASRKNTIVPSLLRLNLRSYGTLLNTELPSYKSKLTSEQILPYAISVLTDKYLSLQGQDNFVTPEQTDLEAVAKVLENHQISSISSSDIEDIVLMQNPSADGDTMKNALLDELKAVLGDTCYTSIKADLVQALDPGQESESIQGILQKSDSPVTDEVLNSATQFYKTIVETENPLKFKQGLDVLDKNFNNGVNNLKTEFLKNMRKEAHTEIKNSNDDNNNNNIKNEDNQNNFIPDSNNDKLNLELSKENMDKDINDIKVERKEQKNETNVQNKNNLKSPRYNNPSSLNSVQNPQLSDVMLESDSLLKTINSTVHSLVTLLEQRDGLNNYRSCTTLLQLQNNIKLIDSCIQQMNNQRSKMNNVSQNAQNITRNRMTNAYNTLSNLQNRSSQFGKEVSMLRNNLETNSVNYVLNQHSPQGGLDVIQQRLNALLSNRKVVLSKFNNMTLSNFGQNQYIALVSQLKSINSDISETTKKGNEIIAQLEDKNQMNSFRGMPSSYSNSSYSNSGTMYGSNNRATLNFDTMK